MLRNKTYNIKKNKGLNYFFKQRHRYKDINFCEINNIIIKQNTNFDIIKETILETYIISLKNIILIHLEEKEYQDFIYLYKNSNEYSFDIYSTINYKNNKIYHIFCTSKFIDNIPSNFLDGNECEYKYRCLEKCYGSCLIINRRFNMSEIIDKFNSKYVYVKYIGKDITINNSIRNFIQQIISLVNTYYIEYLPINYLDI